MVIACQILTLIKLKTRNETESHSKLSNLILNTYITKKQPYACNYKSILGFMKIKQKNEEKHKSRMFSNQERKVLPLTNLISNYLLSIQLN